MQTTTLRVRVSTPSGLPAAGASITARLSGVGISLIDGYIDRTRVEALADAEGVAVLVLWPSAVGMTDVEYRITARGSDGAILLDELVTVPESGIEVWLHDIVMLPPPKPMPYDEASITVIQQSRIQAVDAATAASESRAVAASHAIDVAEAVVEIKAVELEAAGHAEAAESAKQSAELFSQASERSRWAAEKAETAAAHSANKAADSDSNANAAAQSMLSLFCGIDAVMAAVAAADIDAASAAVSRAAAADYCRSAMDSAESAERSAISTAADRAAINHDLAASRGIATQLSSDLASAEAIVREASSAACASIERSAGLIAHAENIRGEIDDNRKASEAARASIDDLYLDLSSIGDAVAITYLNRAICSVSLSNNIIVLSVR